MKENIKEECTLSDQELVEKCDKWVSDLCKTGGQAWVLSVPVNFDKDPDMLFCELINRFRAEKGLALDQSTLNK